MKNEDLERIASQLEKLEDLAEDIEDRAYHLRCEIQIMLKEEKCQARNLSC